jgi:hypothetical protein
MYVCKKVLNTGSRLNLSSFLRVYFNTEIMVAPRSHPTQSAPLPNLMFCYDAPRKCDKTTSCFKCWRSDIRKYCVKLQRTLHHKYIKNNYLTMFATLSIKSLSRNSSILFYSLVWMAFLNFPSLTLIYYKTRTKISSGYLLLTLLFFSKKSDCT